MGRRPVPTQEEIDSAREQKRVLRKLSKSLDEPTARNFLADYDAALPSLISKNLQLQQKALSVIEAKIDQASAAQAATIYGILWDKVNGLVGSRGAENNTFNMYFGDGMKADEMGALFTRVMDRMENVEPIEVEATEVKDAGQNNRKR